MRRQRRYWRNVLALGAAAVSFAQAPAQAQLFQGPYGTGGTWNIYEVVTDPLQWWAAQQDAAGRTQQGKSGNLVSIHSAAENAFVRGLVGSTDAWIGLTDREGAAPNGTSGGLPAPQESQGLASNLTQGWAWTSGEPFTFQAWGGGEPNNWDGAAAGTATSGIEDVTHIRGDGLWNDAGGGFGLNEPIVPTRIPNSSNDETGAGSLKYVVEYNTMAASPFPGINSDAPTVFPADRLGGPKGTAGKWGVVDYKGDFTATSPATNVITQIRDIQAGDIVADKFEGQLPWLDVTDPDTNGNGGPALNNALDAGMFRYLSDNEGTDDNDMISLAHARIKVTEPGEYTFNVHSDDGFAFRIMGANFSAVQGNGTLDPLSANTMVHQADTGDANTQAVVNLAAGEYNLEFMSWERGGGAFYELTAAKGNFISNADGKRPQWLAVGDPQVLAERIQAPAAGAVAVLNAPMTVINVNNFTATDGLEVARETLLGAGDGDAKRTDAHVFVLEDHNISAAGCPFGVFPHDGDVVQFPNTAGDLNNFATSITGSFKIDDGDATGGETLEISFHVDSDDRAAFRIKGQDFIEVSGQQLFEIDGDDAMWGDVDTCNTDFTGLITLKEGVNYEFEALHVENGGDAGMQVLAAMGNQLGNNDPALFKPLRVANGPSITFARNPGFQLVPEVEGIKGDFNSNGQLDAGDLDLLAGGMASNNAAFDLDGDSDADYNDRLSWVRDLKKTWVGDANLDGEFNSGDLVSTFVVGKFETGAAAGWAEGDFDGNGKFETSDFVAAFTDGGYENGPRAAVAAVPEPTTLTSLVLGALGLLGFVRRRRG